MQKTILRLIAFVILISPTLQAQQPQPKWPEITQQNKPWARWWWQGSAVNEKDLSWMLEEYEKVGLGGLEITSIYGTKGYEKDFVDFLSQKWLSMLQYSLKEAARLDLGIDVAQAAGWPFGGPWIKDEDASKYFTYKSYSLAGGQKLNELVQYQQEPLVRTVGEKTEISKLVEPITSNPNLQRHAFDQVRFPKQLPLQTLMAYSEKGESVDLTSKVDQSRKLQWTAPSGSWKLYAVFQGWHGKMVERAAPGGEGYSIDHFSHQATVNFLNKYDEVFKGQDLKHVRAFFNDSYEVDDAEGEANWTPEFFMEFEKRRGYDLKQHLPALFGQDNADKNVRVLCDYRETISDLLLENYTETWHKWAGKYGKLIRNQAHGSPANILDLYAATDIPEVEGENILRFKFASSAANVTGKPLVSCEAATWENEHFLSTLGDIKKEMDRFILAGVNHTFYHGANYTPKDAAWPGWLFYAAVHFTPNNPFWEDFSKLNQYMARIQSFMQKGKPANDILLYLPIYDAFSKPGHTFLQHFDGIEHGFKGTSLEECAKTLQEKGYSFDYISDKQLLNTSVRDGQIQTGGISYKTIVVPEVKYISLATAKKLVELASTGVSIVFYKNLPSDVQGLSNLQQRQEEFKKLISKFSFRNPDDVQKASVGNGSIIMGDDLSRCLASILVYPETIVGKSIKFVRRQHDVGYYYFLTNWSEKPINGWVPLQTNAASVAIFNPMSEKTGFGEIRKAANNNVEVYIQLVQGESVILETNEKNSSTTSYPYVSLQKPQEIKGNWNISFVKGGPTLPQAINTTKLDSWTNYGNQEYKNFSGTASYTITFKKPTAKADAYLLDLGSVSESATVLLNGKVVGTSIGPVYSLEIPAELVQKQNRLEIRVSNSMANRIIYMDKNNLEWKKFYNINMPSRFPENRGKDKLFTAENWTFRPSGLLGPVTLTPVLHQITDLPINSQ